MSKTKQPKWVNVEGRFNVAGVQYSDYQLVVGGLKPGMVCDLIGEPTNQYDNKAIRIEYKGIKLGYVPARSIQQSELWTYHEREIKLIAIVTAYNRTNPTHMMITMQAMRVTGSEDNECRDVKF